MSTKQMEPVSISDTELAKFWGANLTSLTLIQKTLIADLFKEVKRRAS